MRVRVDASLCVGHGRCYALAPEIFGEDERGRCLIASEEVPEALTDRARMGADNCPEEAIEILEDPDRRPATRAARPDTRTTKRIA